MEDGQKAERRHEEAPVVQETRNHLVGPPDLHKAFFTYEGFRSFLLHAKQFGEIVPLREWRPNCIILRHDIDLDIGSAYRLAQMEADLGIRATYFFMVTGSYNALSAPNRGMLQEIAAMGFEIGLHFNPAIYEEKELEGAVAREREVLESLGAQIQSISLHDPSGYGSFPIFEGYLNAYDPRIFSDALYLSDSKMDFRGKDPYTFIEQRGKRTAQMLFHPGHFSESGHNYQGIFQEYLRGFCGKTDRFWSNNTTYKTAFPLGLFAAIIQGKE